MQVTQKQKNVKMKFGNNPSIRALETLMQQESRPEVVARLRWLARFEKVQIAWHMAHDETVRKRIESIESRIKQELI